MPPASVPALKGKPQEALVTSSTCYSRALLRTYLGLSPFFLVFQQMPHHTILLNPIAVLQSVLMWTSNAIALSITAVAVDPLDSIEPPAAESWMAWRKTAIRQDDTKCV